MPKPVFRVEKCKACQLCVSVCPKKILELSTSMNNKGYYSARCFDEAACIGCSMCARMCPDTVIEVYQ